MPTRIVPELQQLSLGMIFPALPGARDGFILLVFEPERFLILGWRSSNGTLLMTWAFVLQETGKQGTRLIVRARAGPGYQFQRLPWWPGKQVARFVHFVMQRKQLLGIAKRAESASAATLEPARQKSGGAA